MWLIAGTLPNADFPLLTPDPDAASPAVRVAGGELLLRDGRRAPVERGSATLAAACAAACGVIGVPGPELILAGDTGDGAGSRALYAWLAEHLPALRLRGVMFHYLFPDVDWHNRVLMAIQECDPRPLLLADAGFMYVAKMSGYGAEYDLFTPDVGELAFLADEKAPHPFYTRGFLLEGDHNIPPLLERVLKNGQAAKNLLIKGAADHVVAEGRIAAVIDAPSVPAMECIGGTGDIVAGLTTAFAMAGLSLERAMIAGARSARLLAAFCRPEPDTQAGELVRRLPEALADAKTALRKDELWPSA